MGKIYLPHKRKTAYGKRVNPFRKKTLTRKVNRLLNSIEKKHIDKSIGIDFANDTNPLTLTTTTQGDTSSTRTGLKIYAKSLVMHYTIDWPDTATQETNCRLLIFLDKNPQGAVPSTTDLLEAATTDSLYNNVNEGRRFVVLYDKHFNNLNPTTTVPRDQGGVIKLKINKNIWYLDSTSAGSSLGRNQLFILPLGDVTNTHADAASIDGNCRVYFDDM